MAENEVPQAIHDLLMQASVDATNAQTARTRAVTNMVAFTGLVALMLAPALVIYVYAALWQWLQP